jgi:hypothetical protein
MEYRFGTSLAIEHEKQNSAQSRWHRRCPPGAAVTIKKKDEYLFASDYFRKRYPKFPGVKTCVDLLRRSNVKGEYLDTVMWELAGHAADAGTAELAEAYRAETDDRVRGLILSILAETASPADLPLFVETLAGANADSRKWAAVGLHKIDTPESRRALWEARARRFADAEEAARHLQMLDDVKQWDRDNFFLPGRSR